MPDNVRLINRKEVKLSFEQSLDAIFQLCINKYGKILLEYFFRLKVFFKQSILDFCVFFSCSIG